MNIETFILGMVVVPIIAVGCTLLFPYFIVSGLLISVQSRKRNRLAGRKAPRPLCISAWRIENEESN
jgi:hypothetical protein